MKGRQPDWSQEMPLPDATESELRLIEQEMDTRLDDGSIQLLEQVRADGLLSSEEWSRLKQYLRSALRFLRRTTVSAEASSGGRHEVAVDADPRSADWLRIVRAWRLAGRHLPAWAALWLWWLKTDSVPGFWPRVGEIAGGLGCRPYRERDR